MGDLEEAPGERSLRLWEGIQAGLEVRGAQHIVGSCEKEGVTWMTREVPHNPYGP